MRRRRRAPGISLFAFQDIITAVAGIFILITLILSLQLQLRKFDVVKEQKPNEPNLVAAVDEAESRARALEVEYEERTKLQGELSEVNPLNIARKLQEAKADVRTGKEVLERLAGEVIQRREEVDRKQKMNQELGFQLKGLDPTKKEISDLKRKLADYSARSNQVSQNQGVIYRDEIDSSHFVCLVQVTSRGIQVKDAATKQTRKFNSRSNFEKWLDGESLSARHFVLLFEPSGASDFDAIKDDFRGRNTTYGFDLVEAGHEASLTFEWEVQP